MLSTSGTGLLDCLDEPPVFLAHFPGLDKSPRAFLVDAAEILLHIGDVGFEIPPDQFGVGAHVFSGRGQERPFGRDAGMGRTTHHKDGDQQRQGDVARTGHVQGKTPLPTLRSRLCQLSPLSEQGNLRQVVLIVLLSFMLSCIARGVATPWARDCTQAEEGPKGRP